MPQIIVEGALPVLSTNTPKSLEVAVFANNSTRICYG